MGFNIWDMYYNICIYCGVYVISDIEGISNIGNVG